MPRKSTKKASAKKKPVRRSASVAKRVGASKKQPPDWRSKLLSQIRRLIEQAVPEAIEEVKWRKPSNPAGVPVWSHDGIICTGETYQDKVKVTFAKGASLEDPAGLFNASLAGNTRRAIDFFEGDEIDGKALQALVREAVTLNTTSPAKRGAAKPKLLSGGNPQIAKADGDAPVQAYIAAMPGWKRDVGRQLDALVVRTVPGVRKAVRWNTPFYGIEGQGWFLAFHCFTKYIKVTFLNGTSLRPLSPVESKNEGTRYLHIYEDGEIDEERLADWVKQAAELPGERCF